MHQLGDPARAQAGGAPTPMTPDQLEAAAESQILDASRNLAALIAEAQAKAPGSSGLTYDNVIAAAHTQATIVRALIVLAQYRRRQPGGGRSAQLVIDRLQIDNERLRGELQDALNTVATLRRGVAEG